MNRDPRWISLGLAGLLVLGLALRVANASVGLDEPRFWDERYSTENVDAVLFGEDMLPKNGIYLGLNHLPPAALIWLIERLHEATGIEALSMVRENGWRINDHALFVCRILQSVYGTLSLWVLFLLGRRLFSSATGLLAALLLAAAPIHIRMSSEFKPDILVVLATLLAVYWSVDALRRPSTARYAAAGAAVGLATAAKYTGVPAAIPLASATLWGHWTDPDRWRRLAVAAGASVASFFLFNPYVGILLRDLPRIAATNSRRAVAAGTTRADVLPAIAKLPLSRDLLGPIVGATALLGLLALVLTLVARDSSPRRRLGAHLVLSYTLGFSLFFTIASPQTKDNLFLTLLPFFCLAAAHLAVSAWSGLEKRSSILRRPTVAIPVWGILAAWIQVPAIGYATAPLVPTNQEVALTAAVEAIETTEPSEPSPASRAPRFVYVQTADAASLEPLAHPRIAVAAATDFTSLDQKQLDSADAEIFPESSLAAGRASFYEQRQAFATRILTLDRIWPFARGPGQLVVAHPWEWNRAHFSMLERSPESGSDEILFPLAAAGCGHLVSLEIGLPGSEHYDPPVVTIADHPVAVFVMLGREGHGRHFVTARVPAASLGPVRIVHETLDDRRMPLRLGVHHWSRPETGDRRPAIGR